MDKRLENLIDKMLKDLEDRKDIHNKENAIKELVLCEDWETFKDIKIRYGLS